MVDVVKAFGANNESAYKEMKDVLKLEMEIAKVKQLKAMKLMITYVLNLDKRR